jgi:uncharacterized membrane protein YdjX (TVP38/TMEM64 family)
MQWLSTLLLQLAALGVWGAVLFVLLYIAATITMAPAFLLTVAAGAIWGVWNGSLLVLLGASLGASAAYLVARRLSGTRVLAWIDRNPRIAAARNAVRHEGAWVQFLLRLSPVVPFILLNYALGLARVRYRDFLIALVGMIPAIVMYAYYGKVVGDVALLAAGVAPPRGPGYYVLLSIGLAATILATTLITRAARRAIDEQRRLHPSATTPGRQHS